MILKCKLFSASHWSILQELWQNVITRTQPSDQQHWGLRKVYPACCRVLQFPVIRLKWCKDRWICHLERDSTSFNEGKEARTEEEQITGSARYPTWCIWEEYEISWRCCSKPVQDYTNEIHSERDKCPENATPSSAIYLMQTLSYCHVNLVRVSINVMCAGKLLVPNCTLGHIKVCLTWLMLSCQSR